MPEVAVFAEVAIGLIGFVDDCSYSARQIVVLAEKVMESSIISQVTSQKSDIRCKPKPLNAPVESPHW
jgi:hypothetical protein